jgi:DNA-binding response OmpR family regulator
MLARRACADGAQAEPVSASHRRIGVSPSRSVAPAGLSASASCRVRVLLVDGDPETRARLAAVLARQGFDVQSFDSDPPLLRSAASPDRDGAAPTEKIVCGKLVIDLAQRRAWWDGVEVRLTAGELAIVVLLVSHAGRCIDNRTVYDSLHYKGFLSGQGDKGYWVNVRSAIRRIRNKFRAIDSSFGELENARAFGYRWRAPA